MKLWLDDIRNPRDHGRADWFWAKTAAKAIATFRTGEVEQASLDHDLTEEQMVRGGYLGEVYEDGQKSGYDVVCWLEEHPEFYPKGGVTVHSANPAGRQRMEQVLRKIEECQKLDR
jgi:hypothetical protein